MFLSEAKTHLRRLSSRQKLLLGDVDPRSESKILDFYVRIVTRVLNADRCSVFIHDPKNKKVWLRLGTGVKERGIEVSVKYSVVGEVINSGNAIIANNLEARNGVHKSIDLKTGFVTREIICVPVRSKERSEITGAIEVLNKKSGGGFAKEDQVFLEEVAENVQNMVDSVFLGQEVFGMTEKLIKITQMAIVIGGVMIVGSVILVVSLWAIVPSLMG